MLSIKWRQYNLKYYYNYYKGALDNKEGSQLKQAYKDFQKAHGLVVDGIYGIKTNAKLVEVAKDLQKKLNSKGSYNLVVDGEIGTKTINAIKDFQKKNGLVVDGVAGKNTYAKLNTSSKPSISLYMTDKDWEESKYFKKSEFKCPCGKCNGYGNGIYKTLVNDLNILRTEIKQAVFISSGYRCPAYNKTLVGSIPDSPHTKGMAVDFYCVLTKSQADRINLMNNKVKKLPNYKHTYCNINGNHPNMSDRIHYDIKG